VANGWSGSRVGEPRAPIPTSPMQASPQHAGLQAQPEVKKIQEAVVEVFDLRPAAIIRDLDLLRPIYAKKSRRSDGGYQGPQSIDSPAQPRPASSHLCRRQGYGKRC
jgi:hypothetical protein